MTPDEEGEGWMPLWGWPPKSSSHRNREEAIKKMREISSACFHSAFMAFHNKSPVCWKRKIYTDQRTRNCQTAWIRSQGSLRWHHLRQWIITQSREWWSTCAVSGEYTNPINVFATGSIFLAIWSWKWQSHKLKSNDWILPQPVKKTQTIQASRTWYIDEALISIGETDQMIDELCKYVAFNCKLNHVLVSRKCN